MTVCDLCKGTGRLLKPWYDTTGAMMGMTGDICFMCDGKGTIGKPLTEQEYIQTCNTEQLADVIADFYLLGYTNGYNETDIAPKKKWVEWLKQPHTPIS